ncbi:hypothetical protein [Mesorhizobium caraganae]|uniref:hypothetical protein n=1 Tax=Mesorhizobium caraganae TaxID=483206 RepID=UPI0017841DD3|nr:hypothetical protein [Mesorhizobium caraganae]
MSKRSDEFLETELGKAMLILMEKGGSMVPPATLASLADALRTHLEDWRAAGEAEDPELKLLSDYLSGRAQLSRGRPPKTTDQRAQPRWDDNARGDYKQMRDSGTSKADAVTSLAKKYRMSEETILNAIGRKKHK